MVQEFPYPEGPEENPLVNENQPPESGVPAEEPSLGGAGAANEYTETVAPEEVSEETVREEPSNQSVPTPAGPTPLSQDDERTWAMLAHLSVLVNLVTGLLGPVVALIIYLVFRDRSRKVAYHAMQSFIFQLVWWVAPIVLMAIMWIVTILLSAIIIGLLCIPFAIVLTLVLGAMMLVALIYGVIAAIDVNQGRPFKYWLTGDWVDESLRMP